MLLQHAKGFHQTSLLDETEGPSVRLGVSLATLMVIGALVVTPLFSLSPQARADPQDAPCRPRVASILFHVWNSQATIIFRGVSYTDGGVTSIQWGCGQSYSIQQGSMGANFLFRQWASDAGSFSSQTATSATFYPAGNSGAITMITQYPGNLPISNWGGYIGDTAAFSETTYSMSLQLTVPDVIAYVPSPNNGNDVVSVWVGLGGCASGFPPPCSNTNALWQAGFYIHKAQSGAQWINPFTDECLGAGQCQLAYQFSNNAATGDTVWALVSYSSGGGVAYSIRDFGPGYVWWISGGCPGHCYTNFVPSLTTSELIVEAPVGGLINECGVPAGYQCVMPNFGTVTFPNNTWGPSGADWSIGYLRCIAADGHSPLSNFANPGYFTSGSLTKSGQWSVSWGTNPVP